MIYALSKPAPRGFFCDDTSIRYPIKPDTIPMWLLGVYGGIGPVLIVSIFLGALNIFLNNEKLE